MTKPTFVIGDVHGHADRLLDLLIEAEIVNEDGIRLNHDVEVVQVGDLGHFGVTGSPTGDVLCYEKADEWFDVLLWGNHDRALVDQRHRFTGYYHDHPYGDEILKIMEELITKGKLRYAHASHGFLITHAGVHKQFSPHLYEDAEESAEYLNSIMVRKPIINNIPAFRGGLQMFGGILWRDWHQEELSDVNPQICGHTAPPFEVRHEGKHWCIDIGDKDNGKLAGIWLPNEEVVEVDLTSPKARGVTA